jgi:hypothetical protein
MLLAQPTMTATTRTGRAWLKISETRTPAHNDPAADPTPVAERRE